MTANSSQQDPKEHEFKLFRAAFKRNEKELTDNMRLTRVLKACLLDKDALNDEDLEEIEALARAGRTNGEQVKALLDCLKTKPNERFVPFCEALVKSDMKNVVQTYFSDYVSVGDAGVVTLRSACISDSAKKDKQTPAEPESFRDALNGKLADLTKLIDIRNNAFLLSVLQDKGVIDQDHAQAIKKKPNNAKQVEKLLEILKGRSVALFPAFIETLNNKDVGLGHVVDQLWPEYKK